MLSLPYIRENKDLIIKGLAIRNFPNAEIIVDQILDKDAKRRASQAELDNTLAESNKLSKEIGGFYKSGEVQKATLAKEKTGQLKERSKVLTEELDVFEGELKELLYQIPNIPNKLVPAGSKEEDNEVFLKKARYPRFMMGLPHTGSFAKNMTSLILNWAIK